jgi:hypothetical protein
LAPSLLLTSLRKSWNGGLEPAAANRYKAFISLCYREGVRNGKVAVNPARSVRQRKEGTGRLRFLSREEYDRLHKVIAARFPNIWPNSSSAFTLACD